MKVSYWLIESVTLTHKEHMEGIRVFGSISERKMSVISHTSVSKLKLDRKKEWQERGMRTITKEPALVQSAIKLQLNKRAVVLFRSTYVNHQHVQFYKFYFHGNNSTVMGDTWCNIGLTQYKMVKNIDNIEIILDIKNGRGWILCANPM